MVSISDFLFLPYSFSDCFVNATFVLIIQPAHFLQNINAKLIEMNAMLGIEKEMREISKEVVG